MIATKTAAKTPAAVKMMRRRFTEKPYQTKSQ
jgi:hypothetical protein